MLKIYVAQNNRKEGPYSLEVIQQKLYNGEISEDALVWWKGNKNWIPIRNIPGIVLPNQSADSTQQSEKGNESQNHPPREDSSEKDTNNLNQYSDYQEEDGGITVEDFQVEISSWFHAGFFWYDRLLRQGIFAYLTCFILFFCIQYLNLYLLTLSSKTAHVLIIQFLANYSSLLLIGSFSWLIIKQFRSHKSVSIFDFIHGLSRAWTQLIGLSLLQTFPAIVFLMLKSNISIVFSFLIYFYSFYSINLLVDKRITFINAILLSVQAVFSKGLSMLFFCILLLLFALSGILLFGIGLVITIPIALAINVFAYLWVFSRNSIKLTNFSSDS